MARFYTNENFPLPAVQALRLLGHDVLTSLDAGTANQAIPDDEILAFASRENRILITLNRKHFIRLHETMLEIEHSGIIVCSFDRDYNSLAKRISDAIHENESMPGKLLRVNRPG
jgi:hypothetical protein